MTPLEDSIDTCLQLYGPQTPYGLAAIVPGVSVHGSSCIVRGLFKNKLVVPVNQEHRLKRHHVYASRQRDLFINDGAIER